MTEEEFQKIALESLQVAFANMKVVEKEMPADDPSKFFDNDRFQFDFQCQLTERDRDPKMGINMFYSARNPEEGHEIQEVITFFGGDEEISIRGAMDELAYIDFPVIHYFYEIDHRDTAAKQLEITENMFYDPMQQPIVESGWKVVMSKQRKVVDTDRAYILGEEAQSLYKALFEGISPLLRQPDHFYFIKCWISRHKTLGMWSDCRVNGMSWEDGVNLLYDYAETWDMGEAEEMSIKQVILLMPVAIAELSDEMQQKFQEMKVYIDEQNSLLQARLKQEYAKQQATTRVEKPQKPWWKFW
ncbi:MAG: DUF6348 family protein [Flammeovirgaceae bacterium]